MKGERTRVVEWFSRYIAFFSIISACRTFGKHSESFIDRFFLASWRSLLLFSQCMLSMVFWFFTSFFPRDLTNLMYFILSSYDHWYQTSVGIARCWAFSDKQYQGPPFQSQGSDDQLYFSIHTWQNEISQYLLSWNSQEMELTVSN